MGGTCDLVIARAPASEALLIEPRVKHTPVLVAVPLEIPIGKNLPVEGGRDVEVGWEEGRGRNGVCGGRLEEGGGGWEMAMVVEKEEEEVKV